MRFPEAQAGEDIKSIFLFLLGPTRSSWLLQGFQIKPAFEAGASLCTCGGFSLAALSPRSCPGSSIEVSGNCASGEGEQEFRWWGGDRLPRARGDQTPQLERSMKEKS